MPDYLGDLMHQNATVFTAAAMVLTLLLSSTASTAEQKYPLYPHPELTPGTTCSQPSEYRYPEKIAYCKRKVDTTTKWEIIAEYDQTYGYEISKMDRQQFKIDHYIPLCMGGSNEVSNLWPQHKTVFELTDPLEQELCQELAEGKIKQKDAIEKIKFAKNNLSEISYLTINFGY